MLFANHVVIGLESRTVRDAVPEILSRVDGFRPKMPIPQIVEAVLKREDVAPTAVSGGLAIPHARISQLRDFYVMFGRAKTPFDDVGTDGRPIDLVFLILCNDRKNTLMLQTLAAVGKIAHNIPLIDSIRGAHSREQLWQAIDDSEIEVQPELFARDLMRPVAVMAREDEVLSELLDRCASSAQHYAPVCDSSGKVIGSMSSREIVNAGFPEYMSSLRDIAFLHATEPFVEFFKLEASARVGEVMNPNPLVVQADDPFIQVVFNMKQHEERLAFVEEDGKCVGVIERDDICERILRA
jgi:PTS system nitrogen regulatory IIA component